jgi:molybdenum cofactor biosynthesis enzyme MoaA
VNILVSRCGITKIRLTGGEPTVHPEFDLYTSLLSSLPLEARGITTNGILFTRMDRIARCFNLVNVSLDTLDSEKFALIAKRPVLNNVLKSLDILSSSSAKIKINTVVMRGINDDELVDILSLSSKYPNTTVRFIELMPFNGNGHANKLFISKEEILDKLGQGIARVRQDPSSSASTYSVNGREFGIISSITDDFCGSCNRIRLTSDGKIRNCLFADTDTETDLVALIRAGKCDEEIEHAIRENVGKKFASHGGKTADELWNQTHRNRAMISLGG